MRKLVFLFFLFTSIGVQLKAQQVEFKASAPEAVVLGNQFRLTYTVNAEGKEFRITEEIADFDVLMGPSVSTSHSTRIVNNQRSSETTVTYTYVLLPKKEGTFNLPPATIKVNNANYSSNAVVVKVLPPDKADEAAAAQAQGGTSSAAAITNESLFVQMQLSKRSVYEQEPILVTFKLYSLHDIAGITNVKFPDFEGFLVQDIEQPSEAQIKLENYNNRNYRTIVLRQTMLYPQRSGKITIDRGSYDVVVRIATQQRVQSIFDDFFNMTRDVKKTLANNAVTVDVKPLPSGKPSSFAGSVGDFTMSSSINTDQLKANEAVTITVKISGTGNVRLVKNPEVQFPNDFEVYDPTVKLDSRTTTTGVTGTKTIEYMAIPRYGGDFEIPAITFSYFDLKSGSYKTLSSQPYKLHVEKGEGGDATSPVVSSFNNRENVRYLGQDIHYLKIKGVNFIKKENVFFGSWMFYLCYLIPALLFIVFFFVYRKQIKENADIALVRTKKANKMAVKRLKNAGKLMKENQKEAFYEEVLRALWGYLSDKLSIPQANLSKDNVETELYKYGVDQTLIDEFMEILNTCEFARYAPSQASDAMDKLYGLTVDAIGKMENTIKKK
ncbi:BatD family protein [Parabacteroides sp. PF5-9]|uniref:BatD family protein n=1 Tax=Parabacteroides sp. PF5-9 TaxID=1742404 RepID=UPI002476014B|nr:BatD family protein [Parabacteroides sp. PF5-9]MDH6358288.1 hypothetical protein [Parabacteroides sp. PF5-9]